MSIREQDGHGLLTTEQANSFGMMGPDGKQVRVTAQNFASMARKGRAAQSKQNRGSDASYKGFSGYGGFGDDREQPDFYSRMIGAGPRRDRQEASRKGKEPAAPAAGGSGGGGRGPPPPRPPAVSAPEPDDDGLSELFGDTEKTQEDDDAELAAFLDESEDEEVRNLRKSIDKDEEEEDVESFVNKGFGGDEAAPPPWAAGSSSSSAAAPQNQEQEGEGASTVNYNISFNTPMEEEDVAVSVSVDDLMGFEDLTDDEIEKTRHDDWGVNKRNRQKRKRDSGEAAGEEAGTGGSLEPTSFEDMLNDEAIADIGSRVPGDVAPQYTKRKARKRQRKRIGNFNITAGLKISRLGDDETSEEEEPDVFQSSSGKQDVFDDDGLDKSVTRVDENGQDYVQTGGMNEYMMNIECAGCMSSIPISDHVMVQMSEITDKLLPSMTLPVMARTLNRLYNQMVVKPLIDRGHEAPMMSSKKWFIHLRDHTDHPLIRLKFFIHSSTRVLNVINQTIIHLDKKRQPYVDRAALKAMFDTHSHIIKLQSTKPASMLFYPHGAPSLESGASIVAPLRPMLREAKETGEGYGKVRVTEAATSEKSHIRDMAKSLNEVG